VGERTSQKGEFMSVRLVFEENGSRMEVEMDAYSYSVQASKEKWDSKHFEVSGDVKSLKPWTPIIAPVA